MHRTPKQHGQVSEDLLCAFSSMVQIREHLETVEKILKKHQKKSLLLEFDLTRQRVLHLKDKIHSSCMYHNDAAYPEPEKEKEA